MSIILSSKRLVFISIFILLIFSTGYSSAIEVTNLQFYWADVPIEYISQNNPVAANINFTFSPSENVTSIIVNASDMNNDIRKLQEYSSISVFPSTCNETQSGVLSCSVKNLVIRTSKNNIKVEFTFNMEDGSKQYASAIKTLTFDNTRPSVIKFGPETCVDDKCYVSSNSVNLIKIQMEDSIATFVRKKVAFRLGTETVYVHECVEKTCFGYATPSCSDGVLVPLAIVQYNGLSSQDDAGNSLTGLINSQVICDANPPTIVNKTVKSSSGLSIITSNDEAVVEVIAKDSVSPKLNMTIIGDNVGAQNVTVQCVKQDSNFVCKGNIKPQTTVFGSKNIQVTLTDVVGNVYRETLTFDYYGADETEAVPLLWRMSNVNQSVNKFVKRNMAYQRTMYAEITLNPISTNTALVKVDSVDAKCLPVNPGVTGSSTDITEVKVLFFNQTTNKIYTKITYREGGQITTGRYANLSSLEHECALKVNSRKGTTFYSKPQEINFTIRVSLSDGGTLDSYLQNEINASKKRIEDNKKYYEWYDQTLGHIITVCKLMGVIEQTYGMTSTLEQITAVIPGGQLISPSLGVASDNLGVVKKPTKPFVQMCNYATCRGEYQQILVGQLNNIPYANDVAQFTGYQNFSDSMDPWKSEYIAYATGCIPAWIHHQKIKNGIECSYLNCLSNGVPNYGTSVSYCQSEKAFSECVYNYGAALNAIPFVSLVKDVSGRIADILSDPYTLFGTAVPFACMALPSGTVTHATCNLFVTITSIPNIIASYTGILQQPPNPAAQCGIVLDNLGTVRQNALIGNYPDEFVYSKEIQLSNKNTVKCGNQLCDVYKGAEFTGVSIQPVYNIGEEKVTGLIFYQDGKQTTTYDLTKDAYAGYFPSAQNRVNYVQTKTVDVEGNLIKRETIDALGDISFSGNIFDQDPNSHLFDMATANAVKQFQEDYKWMLEVGLMDKDGLVYTNNWNDFIELGAEIAIAEKQRYEKIRAENPSFWNDLKYFSELETAQKEYHDALRTENAKLISQNSAIQGLYAIDFNTYTQSNEIVFTDSSGTKIFVDNSGNKLFFHNENEFNKYKDELLKKYVGEKEGVEKTLKEKKEAIDDAKTKIEKAYTFNQYFGTTKNAVRTAWGVASGLSTLQKMFNTQWGSEWWRSESIFGEASQFFRSIADWERTICESDIVSAPATGSGVILNAEPTSGFTTGAFITGRKSAVQSIPNGDSFREYWIDGGVRAKRDGLSYRVVMVDPIGGELDVTFNVTGNYEQLLFAGSSHSFGGMGRSATFKSSTDFSKVCIVFSSSNLRDYFDFVTISGNKFCQNVVGE